MLKINDVIQHIEHTDRRLRITGISEMGITCGDVQLSWEDMFYYEPIVDVNKENSRSALAVLRAHIDHEAQMARAKDARMVQLFNQKEVYWRELSQKKLRIESAEESEFVMFCMFLAMTVSFVFMFGLWIVG